VMRADAQVGPLVAWYGKQHAAPCHNGTPSHRHTLIVSKPQQCNCVGKDGSISAAVQRQAGPSTPGVG
jgi:hypothetical protein